MPLSPDDLKARYDRLSLQLGPGVKAQLVALAKRAGIRKPASSWSTATQPATGLTRTRAGWTQTAS